jgi:hypothetical protein
MHSLRNRDDLAPAGENDSSVRSPYGRWLGWRSSERKTPSGKIFGIGTLKTGTTSLGAALSILGFNHTHKNREKLLRHVREKKMEPVYRWVDRHDSFDDWPWPLVYRELDARYPGSRFILTVRTRETAWLDSMVRHSEWVGPTRGREMFFGSSAPVGHEREYLARYREHITEVREHFRGRPDQLLEISWGKGDEWQRLCDFLGVPIPDVPFPKINTGANPIHK